MAFNVNAQVILSGPKNLAKITKTIQSQLSSINVPIKVVFDNKAAKQLTNFNKGLGNVQTNLKSLNTTMGKTAANFNKLGKSGAAGFNNTGTAATKAATNIKKVKTASEEAASEVEEFGKQSALAIRRFAAFTIATGAVFGFVRAVQEGIKEGIGFEREMARIVQVTGATGKNLSSLRKTVDGLSTSLGISANELLAVGKTFAQTGQTLNQVENSLRAVARASLAPTFGTMASTTEGLIAAMAQFNIQADRSEAVLGSLNAVSKRFAVESGDLISVIRRAGGVFAAASTDLSKPEEALSELLGIFTAVRATTRETADTIATGLRTIFSRLQRKSTLDFLTQFNIQLTDTEGKFVGFFESFRRISKGIEGISARGDTITLGRIVEELGGIRQIGKLLPALQQFSKAEEARKVALEGTGSITKDVGIATATLSVQIERTTAKFNELFRKISQSGTFNTIAKSMLATANAAISVADSLRPILPLLTAIAAVKLGQGLFGFGKGFVGGLKKQGAEGTGAGLASGLSGSGAAAATNASKRQSDAALTNSKSLQSNTKALGILSKAIGGSTTTLTGQSKDLSSKLTAVIAAVNRIPALLGGGGTRPLRPKKSNGGPIPKFAKGGKVRGPSHANGGVIAELEGGETVIPKKFAEGDEVKPLRLKTKKQGEIAAAFFMNPAKGQDPSYSLPSDLPVAPKKGTTQKPIVFEKGSSLKGFVPFKNDLTKNKKVSDIVDNNVKSSLEGLVNNSTKSINNLDILPTLDLSDSNIQDAIGRLKKDSGVVGTIGGYVFEGVIQGITKAKLGGSSKNFDFPNITEDLHERFASLFTTDKSKLKGVVKGDAKRVQNNKNFRSIFKKLANDYKKGDDRGVTVVSGGKKATTDRAQKAAAAKASTKTTNANKPLFLKDVARKLGVAISGGNAASKIAQIQKASGKTLTRDGESNKYFFASGGQVPVSISNGEAVVPPGEAQGNLSKLKAFNSGKSSSLGNIGFSVAKGPGTGTSDSINTTLPSGSFVIKKSQTDKLASGGLVRSRFADGGAVGGDAAGSSAFETLTVGVLGLVAQIGFMVFSVRQVSDELKKASKGLKDFKDRLDKAKADTAKGTNGIGKNAEERERNRQRRESARIKKNEFDKGASGRVDQDIDFRKDSFNQSSGPNSARDRYKKEQSEERYRDRANRAEGADPSAQKIEDKRAADRRRAEQQANSKRNRAPAGVSEQRKGILSKDARGKSIIAKRRANVERQREFRLSSSKKTSYTGGSKGLGGLKGKAGKLLGPNITTGLGTFFKNPRNFLTVGGAIAAGVQSAAGPFKKALGEKTIGGVTGGGGAGGVATSAATGALTGAGLGIAAAAVSGPFGLLVGAVAGVTLGLDGLATSIENNAKFEILSKFTLAIDQNRQKLSKLSKSFTTANIKEGVSLINSNLSKFGETISLFEERSNKGGALKSISNVTGTLTGSLTRGVFANENSQRAANNKAATALFKPEDIKNNFDFLNQSLEASLKNLNIEQLDSLANIDFSNIGNANKQLKLFSDIIGGLKTNSAIDAVLKNQEIQANQKNGLFGIGLISENSKQNSEQIFGSIAPDDLKKPLFAMNKLLGNIRVEGQVTQGGLGSEAYNKLFESLKNDGSTKGFRETFEKLVGSGEIRDLADTTNIDKGAFVAQFNNILKGIEGGINTERQAKAAIAAEKLAQSLKVTSDKVKAFGSAVSTFSKSINGAVSDLEVFAGNINTYVEGVFRTEAISQKGNEVNVFSNTAGRSKKDLEAGAARLGQRFGSPDALKGAAGVIDFGNQLPKLLKETVDSFANVDDKGSITSKDFLDRFEKVSGGSFDSLPDNIADSIKNNLKGIFEGKASKAAESGTSSNRVAGIAAITKKLETESASVLKNTIGPEAETLRAAMEDLQQSSTRLNKIWDQSANIQIKVNSLILENSLTNLNRQKGFKNQFGKFTDRGFDKKQKSGRAVDDLRRELGTIITGGKSSNAGFDVLNKDALFAALDRAEKDAVKSGGAADDLSAVANLRKAIQLLSKDQNYLASVTQDLAKIEEENLKASQDVGDVSSQLLNAKSFGEFNKVLAGLNKEALLFDKIVSGNLNGVSAAELGEFGAKADSGMLARQRNVSVEQVEKAKDFARGKGVSGIVDILGGDTTQAGRDAKARFAPATGGNDKRKGVLLDRAARFNKLQGDVGDKTTSTNVDKLKTAQDLLDNRLKTTADSFGRLTAQVDKLHKALETANAPNTPKPKDVKEGGASGENIANLETATGNLNKTIDKMTQATKDMSMKAEHTFQGKVDVNINQLRVGKNQVFDQVSDAIQGLKTTPDGATKIPEFADVPLTAMIPTGRK